MSEKELDEVVDVVFKTTDTGLAQSW